MATQAGYSYRQKLEERGGNILVGAVSVIRPLSAGIRIEEGFPRCIREINAAVVDVTIGTV